MVAVLPHIPHLRLPNDIYLIHQSLLVKKKEKLKFSLVLTVLPVSPSTKMTTFITPSISSIDNPDRPDEDHGMAVEVPPINTKKMCNFSVFNSVLIKLAGPNGFNYKSSLSYLVLESVGHLN